MAVVRESERVSKEPVDRSDGAYIQWLISRKDGARNFELRKFTLSPRGRIPPHLHDDIEHEQYVLKGRYTIIIDDKKYKVKEGTVVYIPPGAVHEYLNDSDEEAEFLCIIPAREKYKTTWIDRKQHDSLGL
jgi:quercetin dioxygenase-like cupin family protein